MCPRKGGRRSLEEFVTISDPQVSLLVQEVLCQTSPIWLDHAEEHFLNNLDFFKPLQVKTQLTAEVTGPASTPGHVLGS